MRHEPPPASQWFGSAQWIWCGVPCLDLVNAYMQARRVFTLERAPRRAEVRVTADAGYRLYVNGAYVTRGPARGFQRSWPFDRVDVAPYLRHGRNVVAALVHTPGVDTYSYAHEGRAGLLLAGRAGPMELATGPAWRVRVSPGHRQDCARICAQLGFQEQFDSRLDDGQWRAAGGDESGWRDPVCYRLGRPPWSGFEERGIPLLREAVRAPSRCILSCTGRSSREWRDARCVAAVYAQESRAWDRPLQGWRRRGAWLTTELPPAGAGRFSSHCLDFGEEVTGTIRLEAQGAEGGEALDCIGVEWLDEGRPAVRSPVRGERGLAIAGRVVLGAGRTAHEFFSPWGLRYLVLTARGLRGPVRVRVGVRTTGYPLRGEENFRTSDKRLQAIWRMAYRSLQCCMLDAYVDCPSREQGQWDADAHIMATAAFHLSGDTALFARCLRQVGAQRSADGLPYAVVPSRAHNCVLPDFSLLWILGLRDHWWRTGDLSVFRSMADAVREALAYFKDQAGDQYLLPHDPRHWLYLDVAGSWTEGYVAHFSLLYLAALRAAQQLFHEAGDESAAEEVHHQVLRVTVAARRAFLDASTGRVGRRLLPDGSVEWTDDARAYAWAVLSGLKPGLDGAFVERMLPTVNKPRPRTGDPNVPAMHFVFEALKAYGREAEVIACIRNWWGDRFLDVGLTTTAEVWDLASHRHCSRCHGWGAHPIVHMSEILGGVRQAAPAWRRARFRPLFVGDSAEARVATPFGAVRTAWRRRGDKVRLSVKVPRGMTMDAVLAGRCEVWTGPCERRRTMPTDEPSGLAP